MPNALSVPAFLQPLAGAYPFGFRSSEGRRLAVVERYAASETVAAQLFDPIARLAAHLFDTPLAFCTLVERERIRLLGAYGFDSARELPNEPGLCTSAIAQHVPYVVEQADLDARTKQHSLVTGHENVRFYVAVPLRVDRQNVGTLCVLDRIARLADPQAVELLEILAELAVDRLERRAVAA
jgi:GAF domain-containing protein